MRSVMRRDATRATLQGESSVYLKPAGPQLTQSRKLKIKLKNIFIFHQSSLQPSYFRAGN